MCDEVRKRRSHNERVSKQAEAWFKTKNHEFFILITDSMIKTHPGLRDMMLTWAPITLWTARRVA